VQLLLWVTAILLAAELVTYVTVHVFWHKPHVVTQVSGSLEDTLRLADSVDLSLSRLSDSLHVALPPQPGPPPPSSLRRHDSEPRQDTISNSNKKVPVVPALHALGGDLKAKAAGAGTGTGTDAGAGAAFSLQDALARNRKQAFLNEARFPGVLDNPSTVVIVVMMHTRVDALTALLASLRRVRGIGAAVLVVSQDVELPEITALVEAIDFCTVLRVFLPAAPALFPASFPGTDPRDCPARASRAKVQELGCLNKVCTCVHVYRCVVLGSLNAVVAGHAGHVRQLPRGGLFGDQAPLVVEGGVCV
jgi:hypothetical protein